MIRMATQAERRASTTLTILDAALSTLEAHGLDGFTTTEVAARSGNVHGISPRSSMRVGEVGPVRAEHVALLASTVEHLFAELRDAYAHEVTAHLAQRAGTNVDPITSAVALLWDVISDPRLLAAFDLYTAARTDRALADAIRPIVETHVGHIRSLALAIVPQILGHDVDEHLAESWIEPTILCMQGLAIQETAQPDLDRRIRVLASITESARALVTSQSAAPGARDQRQIHPRTPSNPHGSVT